MATGFRQHLRQMLGRSIPKYHRGVFDTYVGAPAIMVCYPEDPVLVDDERIDLALCLDNAVRLTDQFHEPIAESLRAAANVVTTTQEIGCLRDRKAQERHLGGIVVEVAEIGGKRELDRFFRAE